jgi:twitching motility two-component system response regulator PilH
VAKITIIDDDVDQAQDLADLLGGAGHTTGMMHQVAGAVEKLAQDKPDMVILDVMFPENPSAGLELAIEIRKNPATGDLPILLLTGVNQEFPLGLSDKDIDPKWLPIEDFVEKPINHQALLGKVAKLLGQA